MERCGMQVFAMQEPLLPDVFDKLWKDEETAKLDNEKKRREQHVTLRDAEGNLSYGTAVCCSVLQCVAAHATLCSVDDTKKCHEQHIFLRDVEGKPVLWCVSLLQCVAAHVVLYDVEETLSYGTSACCSVAAHVTLCEAKGTLS